MSLVHLRVHRAGVEAQPLFGSPQRFLVSQIDLRISQKFIAAAAAAEVIAAAVVIRTERLRRINGHTADRVLLMPLSIVHG
jgi:hypothetical protein